MRAEGIYDVDANTSIDQLSEDLNIKMPEVCCSRKYHSTDYVEQMLIALILKYIVGEWMLIVFVWYVE